MATDINLDLSDELEAKLRARIEKDHVELNDFVLQAVAEKLSREEPQQSKPSASVPPPNQHSPLNHAPS